MLPFVQRALQRDEPVLHLEGGLADLHDPSDAEDDDVVVTASTEKESHQAQATEDEAADEAQPHQAQTAEDETADEAQALESE